MEKLECYITLGWKGFPVTNTIAYWDYSQARKKMKCCEYNPNGLFILNQ